MKKVIFVLLVMPCFITIDANNYVCRQQQIARVMEAVLKADTYQEFKDTLSVPSKSNSLELDIKSALIATAYRLEGTDPYSQELQLVYRYLKELCYGQAKKESLDLRWLDKEDYQIRRQLSNEIYIGKPHVQQVALISELFNDLKILEFNCTIVTACSIYRGKHFVVDRDNDALYQHNLNYDYTNREFSLKTPLKELDLCSTSRQSLKELVRDIIGNYNIVRDIYKETRADRLSEIDLSWLIKVYPSPIQCLFDSIYYVKTAFPYVFYPVTAAAMTFLLKKCFNRS
jgi:hypothetical protein